jgi:galactokinase
MRLALSPEVLKRLQDEASRRGVDREDVARQLIEENLPRSETNQVNETALELMDQWDREDQTTDPEELEQRRRDFEEFNHAMNSSHSSNRKLYP